MVYLIPSEGFLVCVVGVPPPFDHLHCSNAIGRLCRSQSTSGLLVSSFLDSNVGLGTLHAGQDYTV